LRVRRNYSSKNRVVKGVLIRRGEHFFMMGIDPLELNNYELNGGGDMIIEDIWEDYV